MSVEEIATALIDAGLEGRAFFAALDMNIVNNRVIIQQVWDLVRQTYGIPAGIVLSGAFGRALNKFIYDAGFQNCHVAIIDGTTLIDGTDWHPATNRKWIFVDDSIYSAETMFKCAEAMAEKGQEIIGCVVAYDGCPMPKDPMVQSLYRYHPVEGSELYVANEDAFDDCENMTAAMAKYREIKDEYIQFKPYTGSEFELLRLCDDYKTITFGADKLTINHNDASITMSPAWFGSHFDVIIFEDADGNKWTYNKEMTE